MQVALTLTPAEMLVRLYRLRWCAVVAALLIICVARAVLAIDIAIGPLLGLTMGLAAVNLLVGYRLRRGWTTTELEGVGHLAVDTLALSALLYWGGGSTSPFVSLYLVPIAVAAAVLSTGYAWCVTALAAAAYSLLLFATPPVSHAARGGFAMHVFGMWVTFIIGGLLLMVFVAGMAAAVRRRDQSLARAREQMLRNEQVTALGALAAGAAHELSTPLSTMAIIVDELRERSTVDTSMEQDLRVLEQQIGLCNGQINQLLGAAEHAHGQEIRPMPVLQWLETVLDRWRLMRPEVHVELEWSPILSDPTSVLDESVSQALINLLNNAADASLENGAETIAVTAECGNGIVRISIEDKGTGIRTADIERAGRLRFSTKSGGRGLGLVLSHVSLERFGGEVRLDKCPGGGTRTRITLPLAQAPTA